LLKEIEGWPFLRLSISGAGGAGIFLCREFFRGGRVEAELLILWQTPANRSPRLDLKPLDSMLVENYSQCFPQNLTPREKVW